MSKKKQKVAVAISGGVDSSVAAALLKKQGYQVIGFFMHFWSDPHFSKNQTIANKCCSLDAYTDARRVAECLEIPLYTLNLKNNFKKYIVDNFLNQYKQGLTPNPCIRCNQFIKFGQFLSKAKSLNCYFMATGHYVQIKKSKNQVQLLQGKDKAKDQSYFLYRLNQDILKYCLFPIGKYQKSQVRKLAAKFKLPVSQKKDSQEICFVGEKDHYQFLEKYLDLKPGNIINDQNKKIGRHRGLPLYTIGQRKGIELSGGPWYVLKLDFKSNNLVVTNNPQHPDLFHDIMYLKEVNWIKPTKLPLKAEVRIRYLHQGEKGRVKKYNNYYKIQFNNKQRAITPGQSAVFYQNKQLLGGGIISKYK